VRRVSNHSQQRLLRGETLDLLCKSFSHRRTPKMRRSSSEFKSQRSCGMEVSMRKEKKLERGRRNGYWKRNTKWKRAVSLALCGTLAMTTAACGKEGEAAVANTEINTEEETILEQALNGQVKSHSSKTGKEETVYVLADAQGGVNQVIVSSWVKNGEGSNTLSDMSHLSNIENVKGYEGYTPGENGSLTWDAQGGDIYYQGTTDKELPVDVRLSYTLDGQEITPEELAGKSGRVTIRFDYENREKQAVDINGKEEEIYVPFAMISGMVLPSDTFSNVEAKNAKLISEGDNLLAVGVAFPGLRDSLALEELEGGMEDEEKRKELEDLNIPDYIEISADAVDFHMDMTMTMAMSDVLSDISLTDSIDLDDINESMDDLESASQELMDGTAKLKDGTGELKDGTVELKDGTEELKDGVAELKDGTGKLWDGATELKDGTDELKKGASDLKDGTGQLAGGTSDLKAGADTLKGGTQELKEKSGELEAGAGKVDAGAAQLTAGSKALAEGTKALAEGSVVLDAGAAQIQQGLASVDMAIGAMVTACQGADGSMGLMEGSRSLTEGIVGLDTLMNRYFEMYEADINGKIESLRQMAAEAGARKAQAQEGLDQALERQQEAEAALNAACVPETKIMEVEVEAEGTMPQTTISGSVTGYSIEPVTATAEVPVQSISADEVQKAALDYRAAGEAVAACQAEAAAAQAQEDAIQQILAQYTQELMQSGQFGSDVQTASQAAYIKYMKEVSGNLAAGAQTVQAGMDSLYQALLLLNDGQSGVPALAEGAAQLKAGTAAAVEGTKELKTGTEVLDGGIVTLKAGTEALQTGTVKLAEGTGKLDEGAASLQEGAGKLDEGAKELDEGADKLQDGAGKLDDGAFELQDGAAQLDDGAVKLQDGANELDDGAAKLQDGATELDDGALELKDGMIRFDEEGIHKLTDLLGDDVEKVIDRIDALKDAGSRYNTFSGLPEGTEGSVKFIYKTNGIKAE